MSKPDEVLEFWLSLEGDQHFNPSPALDDEIRRRFLADYEAAVCGDYQHWENDPRSTVVVVIVVDQFPRNMFRGQAKSFAADDQALGLAKRAVARGVDLKVGEDLRRWPYLPYMHSEALEDQWACISLCERSGLEDTALWAKLHADVIEKFGRFPHRNAVLGRPTTKDEQAFLDAGGFSG